MQICQHLENSLLSLGCLYNHVGYHVIEVVGFLSFLFLEKFNNEKKTTNLVKEIHFQNFP